MAGALARWFSPNERGLCQSAFAGIGGTAGEGTASVFLPYLALRVTSGWRQSTEIVAASIALIAIACIIFLRSAPPDQQATERKPFEWTLIKDVRLWAYILVYSGSIISLRILPPWLPIYAADIYISRGMPVQQAMLAGSSLFIAYLLGRLVGGPLMGFASDRLLARGISRTSLAIGFLLLSAVLFQVMPVGIRSTVALGAIAFVMGISINMYPLITTAVSETFGSHRTSSVMGFLNTFAQLSGATALFISGYLGIALNSSPGNTLEEYRGIWLVGIIGCVGTALAGILFSVRERLVQPAARLES
jgi:MFS family permease